MPDEARRPKTPTNPRDDTISTSTPSAAESTRKWCFGFMTRRTHPPNDPTRPAHAHATANKSITTTEPSFRPRHAHRDALLSVPTADPRRSQQTHSRPSSSSSSSPPQPSSSRGPKRPHLRRPATSTLLAETHGLDPRVSSAFQNRAAMKRSASTPNLVENGRTGSRLRAEPSMASIREVDDDDDGGNERQSAVIMSEVARRLLAIKERERTRDSPDPVSTETRLSTTVPGLQRSVLEASTASSADRLGSGSDSGARSSPVGSRPSCPNEVSRLAPSTREDRARQPLVARVGPARLKPLYFSHESVPNLRDRGHARAGAAGVGPADAKPLDLRGESGQGNGKGKERAMDDGSARTATDARTDPIIRESADTHKADARSRGEVPADCNPGAPSGSASEADDLVLAAEALLRNTHRFLDAQSAPSSSPRDLASLASEFPHPSPPLNSLSPSSTEPLTSSPSLGMPIRNCRHKPYPDPTTPAQNEQEERRTSSTPSSLWTFASSSTFSHSSACSKDTSPLSTLNTDGGGSSLAGVSMTARNGSGGSVRTSNASDRTESSAAGVPLDVDPEKLDNGAGGMFRMELIGVEWD